MKFLKALFLLLIITNNSIAQEDKTCLFLGEHSSDPPGHYSNSVDSNYFSNECEPIVLSVHFWGINRPNGQNDYPDRKQYTLMAIQNLNLAYNQFGIYFKYAGFEEINSPEISGDTNGYYILESPGQAIDMLDWAEQEGHFKPDSYDVYAYGWSVGFGGISLGTLTGQSALSTVNLFESTMVHEMGHSLNLLHTFSEGFVNEFCETVPRDPAHPNFNADIAQDRIIDTNAMPITLYDSNCACYPDVQDCEYMGNQVEQCVDGSGLNYNITHEDLINAMNNVYNCQDIYLTTGQGIRAREAIIANSGLFGPMETTVASLYEPYEGEYYVGGPLDPNNKPLFQPGFDYRFVSCDCDCPTPIPYEDVSFSYSNSSVLTISKYETDFSLITHPNQTAIDISIIGCDAQGQSVRRCYDNNNRKPSVGTLTHFHDGVFNNNVTITQQDSLQINDPNLIQNLNPGLYAIDKDYIDGTHEQTVIIKEND